jgi:hypothetical protein
VPSDQNPRIAEVGLGSAPLLRHGKPVAGVSGRKRRPTA